MSAQPGTILFLNGTSSSGKSTIARALQEALPRPFMHTGIDHFLERFPRQLFVYSEDHSPAVDGWLLVFQKGRLLRVEIGPAGLRVLSGMYQACAALARAGIDLILDDVLYDPRVLRLAVEALAGLPVFFIGVRIPLELAEEREILRGDRAPGGARFFGESVHAQAVYDLEVDAQQYSALVCAAQIKDWLAAGPQPAALAEMQARFSGEDRGSSFTIL